MNSRFLMVLLSGLVLLTACSKTPPPVAPPAAAAGAVAETSGAPALELVPTETQRVVYDCADGGTIVLRLFDDQRARVDVEGVEQVLRPVASEGGTLFLGDEVNLRITGPLATLSRGGVFLKTDCKLHPPA